MFGSFLLFLCFLLSKRGRLRLAPFFFHHFLNIFPKIVGKNVKATYICETKANNMTTINIFIEQGPEGIDVDFAAWVRPGRFNRFNPCSDEVNPVCDEITWDQTLHTTEENAAIDAYLTDNYQDIEDKIIEKAEKLRAENMKEYREI